MKKNAAFCLLFACACMLFGCADDNRDVATTYPATVTVKLDGKPVEGASVVLSPVDSSAGSESARGTTDSSGVCELTSFDPPVDGAVPGEYVAMVRKIETITEPAPTEDDPNNYNIVERKYIIPQKYEGGVKGQTIKITPEGPNEFTLELTSD